MLGLLGICHSSLFTFLQVKLFPSMWAYGHYFRTKDDNDGHATLDCEANIKFYQSSCATCCDQIIIEGNLDCVIKI